MVYSNRLHINRRAGHKILDDSSGPLSSNYKDMTNIQAMLPVASISTRLSRLSVYKRFCRHRYRRQSQPITRWTSTFIAAKTQAAALDSELAIDYESQKLQIDSILDDFRLLADPLEAYIVTTTSFPWTEQGLQALVEPRQRATRQELPRRRLHRCNPNRPLGQETMIMSVNLSQESLSLTNFNLWVLTESRGGTAKMRTSSIATCPTSTTSINCRSTEPLWRLKRKYLGQKQQDDRAVN